MNSTKKKGKFGALMVGVIIGLSLAILVLVTICAVFIWKASREPAAEPTEPGAITGTETPVQIPTEEQETTEPAAEAVDVPQPDMVIDTPFCTLTYPGKWNDQVRIEQVDNGYGHAVNFYGTSQGKETALFSVFFGQSTEQAVNLGTIVKNGISTDVSIEMAAFSVGAVSEEITAMQADADYLIEKLAENLYFQLPEMDEEDIIPDLSDAVVETPYGTLYYSGEWKDAVNWAVSSEGEICTVSFTETFSGQNAPAFRICFGDPEDIGFQMGTLRHNGRDIPVCLTLCDFPQGNDWSDSERSLFLMIQEQAYNMLEKFAEDAPYTSIF